MVTITLKVESCGEPFIFSANVTSGNSITLPLNVSGDYDFTVKWGDGEIDLITAYDDPNITHTYSSTDVFDVEITGKCTWFSHSVSEDTPYVVEVKQWGDSCDFTKLDFRRCINLTTIPSSPLTGVDVDNYTASSYFFFQCDLTTLPTDFFINAVNLTSITYIVMDNSSFATIPTELFEYCTDLITATDNFKSTAITTIPTDLFRYNTSLVTSYDNFGYCTGITTIHADLFKYNVLLEEVSYTFRNCSGITAIPSGLFDTNVELTTSIATFINCSSITGALTTDLFRENVLLTNLQSCFQGCSGVISIPVDFLRYNVLLTNLTNGFHSTSITSIPSGALDYNVNLTNITSTFGSTDITSVPSGLLDNNVLLTTCSRLFWGCTSLTGAITTDLFKYNVLVNDFQWCFYNTAISSIPTALFTYNILVTNFSNTFKFCNSLTVIPATLFDTCVDVTTYESCFEVSSGAITSAVPELWNLVPEPDGTNCFKEQTLATNYASIPNDWKGL